MGELNSFDNLINFSNKISGKSKKLRDCYRCVLEITKGEKLSLPKNLYDTRYYKIYRDTLLGDSWVMSGKKLFGILGTRQTGKTVLLERLYNLVYGKSIFISVLQNGIVSVEELIELLLEEKEDDIDFLFIDELTYIKGVEGLKKFYDFIYNNFKLVFVTATESVKLAELSVEYLANRMQFIPTGLDAVSVRYFDFLRRIEEFKESQSHANINGTLFEFMNAGNRYDSSINLSVSLQSKLDSFIIKGSSMVKDKLEILKDLSTRSIYEILLSYRSRAFQTKEERITALLLFTYYSVVGLKEVSVNTSMSNFVNSIYMPTEGSESYKDLVKMTDGHSIYGYYTDILKSTGVYVEMDNYYIDNSEDGRFISHIDYRGQKCEVSVLCSNIDLVNESFWIFNKYSNKLKKLSINLDRSKGLFTESVFCSILMEVLCIETRDSDFTSFSVYKLKYKRSSVNYEIDCVIDYNETNRLFIGIKSGKPDVEDSLKNIPGYNPMNDRIVVVSASLGDMDYNYNSGICKMSVKQFFKEYLKRWAKEVSGLDLYSPLDYLSKK